jgi:hypothetical protein
MMTYDHSIHGVYGDVVWDEDDRTSQEKEAEAEAIRRRRELSRIAAERRSLAANDPWYPIPHWEVPGLVRFDTPGRNQGQVIEVSYGTFGEYEACENDPYMNVLDHNTGESRTYQRRKIQ